MDLVLVVAVGAVEKKGVKESDFDSGREHSPENHWDQIG